MATNTTFANRRSYSSPSILEAVRRPMRTLGIISFVLLVGCVSSSELAREQGRSFVVNDRSYAEVWNAAVLTVSSVGAIESQDEEHGEVRGLRGASAWSWGDAVAIFIQPPNTDATQHTVTVVSEHTDQIQITGQDFTDTMIATMKAHLNLNE